MIDKILQVINKKLKIDETLKEADKQIERANKITIDGENRWMIKQIHKEGDKEFHCICVERRSGLDRRKGTV